MDRVRKTIDGTAYTITRRQVLAELVCYNNEFPANDYDERPGGPGWLESASYRFALLHEGRLYPPKYLLHRLTGAGLDRFSGGEFTNGAFRRLGFEILRKDAALARQARLLREAADSAYAAGVPARVADLPGVPAVYCMYGGQGAGLYVALVHRRASEWHDAFQAAPCCSRGHVGRSTTPGWRATCGGGWSSTPRCLKSRSMPRLLPSGARLSTAS